MVNSIALKPIDCQREVVVGNVKFSISAGVGDAGSSGRVLWPCSIALAEIISRENNLGICCDIGCGLGLAGIQSAFKGSQTTLIDAELSTCFLAAENVRSNSLRADVFCVDWKYFRKPFDSIFGSEILYRPEWIVGIAEFIKANWTGKGHSLIVNAITNELTMRFDSEIDKCGLNSTRTEEQSRLPDGQEFNFNLWRISK